jgi:hypothetical protein
VLIYEVDMTPFKRGPIALHRAHSERERPACGPYWNAPFDLGPREVKTLILPSWHVRIDVVSKAANGSYVMRRARA